MSQAKREQRETQRIGPYIVPCRVQEADRRLSGYLVDLSPRGAGLVCDDAPPAVGVSVAVEMRFRGQIGHARLDAEVKWARPRDASGGHLVGLKFTGGSPDQRALIERIVEDFRSRARRLLEAGAVLESGGQDGAAGSD
jgi:hypothetical protein